ncbi:MAG: ATP-binding protein [Anaerolineae bacterium]|nr:ATP-binding protein [Anaerolineae bacterium]NUQ06959.1 HAMP domain-containing protein [Anaerolineae bacterium]
MNRLWIRLSLTFSAVILIAFVLVSLISVQLIRANSEQSAAEGQAILMDGLAAQLAAYYQQHESWEGVEALFVDAQDFVGRGRGDYFRLESPSGDLLLESRDVMTPAPIQDPPEGMILDGAISPGDDAADAGQPPDDKRDEFPVVVDGETVAFLSAPKPPSLLFPLFGVARAVGVEELLILSAITIAVISLLSGILISRSMTNPLDSLAATAEEVGGGRMDRRVRATGTVETVSLAQSFNRMVDQLQDAEQKRRNLVADVAHELRTPLSALQAGLYAILDDAYPMSKQEIAGLYEQSRMLGRLVNDLFELTQVDSRQLPLELKPLDLSTSIEDFVAPFRIVAESIGVTFTVRSAPDLPAVLADQSRINQIMHNLLSNALRHTPEDGSITVEVRHAPGDACVEIAVIDTGDGISAQHLPHVFERFYRGDYGRSRDQGGTGLGLAVARALAEAHHGALNAASDGIPGRGATFTLRLPILPHFQPVVAAGAGQRTQPAKA